MTVTIYCSSSDKIDDVYKQEARKLGDALGRNNINIINGAGNHGLMRVVADAVMSAGGRATGVIPRFMVEHGWCYDEMSEIITVESMHERKKLMAERSDAAIALPGGIGTMEELVEIITWQQLKLYTKPVIILNTNNYYYHLLAMFDRSVGDGFMPQNFFPAVNVAATPENVLQMLNV
ncbi:MAG: TIGR00730 family Rossman fold protein [Tannerella sp.]|jgi:uncharacterized protein (TIGR00730 family)|nr:TIGR00730 family Rossman fold protein [Tannerella sp.]